MFGTADYLISKQTNIANYHLPTFNKNRVNILVQWKQYAWNRDITRQLSNVAECLDYNS